MDKKPALGMDIVVIAVGLLAVVFIAIWIINGNIEIYKDTLSAMDASNAVIVQQRDLAIKKLMKKVQAKEEEVVSARQQLASAKTELDASMKKIEAVKAAVQ